MALHLEENYSSRISKCRHFFYEIQPKYIYYSLKNKSIAKKKFQKKIVIFEIHAAKVKTKN